MIPHIATWISPKFGIMISKIINSYIADEYTKSLKEKNNTIIELKIMMEKMEKRAEEAEKRAEEREKKADKISKKLEQKLDDTNDQLSEIKDELVVTNQKLKHADIKLNIAVEDRVIKPSNSDVEDFVLLKNRRFMNKEK